MSEQNAQDREHARAALIDQLTHLIDEMEMLDSIIGRVPEEVLSGRPWEGEWTIKELYGLLAAADEQIRLPNLQAVVSEDNPTLEPLNEAALMSLETWNAWEIHAILERIRNARTALVNFLRALPPDEWMRTGLLGDVREDVYAIAFRITQEDTDYLRALGYRLHESNLTSRPRDLPK